VEVSGHPEYENPYNDEFVKQIKHFLPTLKRANFLGGEPFLIKLYPEIWEAIIATNPDIDVAITSNGTVLNDRIKNIIASLPNLRITLSIDSIEAETWESIRFKGRFGVLQSNLDYLLNTGKLVSFSVCPMIQNRYEIPQIVQFCELHNLDIYFNVVYEPLGGRIKGIHENGTFEAIEGSYKKVLVPETSLQSLPKNELKELIAYYKSFTFSTHLQKQVNSLVQQLVSWSNLKSN
jgi:MoaA/NifB/PqqE/SkfB family radical SAM enzyme